MANPPHTQLSLEDLVRATTLSLHAAGCKLRRTEVDAGSSYVTLHYTYQGARFSLHLYLTPHSFSLQLCSDLHEPWLVISNHELAIITVESCVSSWQLSVRDRSAGSP